MTSSLSELERASLVVLDIFKTIPELQTAKVAIIGGMALLKYLPDYRTTQDVDFCITATGAPSSVKTKLLALPDTPFEQRADLFLYNDGKQLIQIDIVNTMQLPYLPSAAVAVNTIPTDFIPYVSEIDLIVYKIFACGLRPTAAKKRQDANDAYFLLDQQQRSLRLNSQQKKCVAPALQDVIANVTKKSEPSVVEGETGALIGFSTESNL